MPPTAEPNYGVDAPTVIMTFVGLTIAMIFTGIFIGSASGLANAVSFWITAVIFAATALAMIRSSKRGKASVWCRQLDALDLRGDEQALDVGCGRGLVLVELAKRLPEGAVRGIDIWRNKDQSGNGRVTTELNVRLAGVADRVEIIDGDMTTMPFDDASFDLVTASLAIHNLSQEADRVRALDEIRRVLRPGGRLVIVDIARTGSYQQHLAAGWFEHVERSGITWAIYPPARVVTATRTDRVD